MPVAAAVVFCSTGVSRGESLRFTGIESVTAGIHLLWDASPGQYYSVFASPDLIHWTPTFVGATGEFVDANIAVAPGGMFYRVKEVMIPNPMISRGKATVGFNSIQYGQTSGMVDGVFKTFATRWVAGYPTPSAPSWVSIKLGTGPTRVLLSWNSGFNYNYQETDYGGPLNYTISTSPDSTDGSGGTWTQVVSVTNNPYRTRSHSFDFTGMQWVKMVITAAPASSQIPGIIYDPGVVFDEIEVYDISAACTRGRIAEDTWFFLGDSITAFWADRATGSDASTTHQPSFAQCVNNSNTNYFPSMIDGGIGGELSINGLNRLDACLAANPDYKYWGIGYGSNDSAGNKTSTTSFQTNMQAIINKLKANGRVPVLARIPCSSDGSHNTIPLFNQVIDNLVITNGLTPGPDFYAFFLANTNQLSSDHLHPNDAGMRSINLLWSQAMRTLYP